MGFIYKLVAKVILNAVALYIVGRYFQNFQLGGGIETLIVAALVLAALNTFLRPILKLVSTPLLWVTFGLFNLVLNMALLWIADSLLTQLAINDLTTLFWTSILIALANSFF
ncbi:MAG: phage holin family protein [Candidatus Sungiibacteriota bacterium]|uniref:Phage holin family protein n=1 Tax=Candidatus Sungiibacteriota bacterium TaxID=2750080 RepID=A0A7T5RJJ8_9BACT|nr:MAG: phage holin family protein [Candidatus Sungbacteria bacterium]